MKTQLLVFLTIIVLSGCTSVPIPTTEQNTLLAGKLLVNWMSGNEKIKFGIKVYFQDKNTGKVTLILTQKDGWLLTNKLNGNSYTIQKFFIEIRQENTIYEMTLNGPFNITLENGVVNNIGTIQIDIENNKYSYRLVDYDVVKFDFQKDFPDSEWNSYEWKNNNVFSNRK